MNMDEAIQVSCIIDKLPPSWKDFKHTLKHHKEELTLVELGSHLRIKETLRVQDNDKPKSNNVAQNDNNPKSCLYYTTTTRYTGQGIVKLPVKSSQPPHQVFGAAAWGIVRYTKININYAVGGNLKRLSTKEAWETIEDCAHCDKQCKNPTSTISGQTIVNLKAQLVENEVVRVMIPKCMSWLDAYDEPIGDIKDKVDNLSPQSTPQVLLSFEVYTSPVTYPEEVEKTIEILMEVEPLDHTIEDLGLNTCSHDLFPSSREFPSVDEPKPQPLPNIPFLDVNLGGKRGTNPPIKPYSLGIFEEKKKHFFTDPGDGVKINPDGVVGPAIGKFDFI
ncbi:hypothetical protein Tco_0831572 [Tanacetum coccineum]